MRNDLWYVIGIAAIIIIGIAALSYNHNGPSVPSSASNTSTTTAPKSGEGSSSGASGQQLPQLPAQTGPAPAGSDNKSTTTP
jgi:hypothetical protein